MDNNELSTEDKEFLAKCEEKLKHRFTDKDVEFMKIYNQEKSVPPILENWWPPNSGRRRDHRNSYHPYGQYVNRDRHRQRGNQNHRRHDSNDSHGHHRVRHSNY